MIDQQTTIEAFRADHRLHPMTLIQRLIVSLPGLLVLLLPLLSGNDPTVWIYLIGLAAYGFIAVPAMVLHYLRFRFRIDSRELHIDSGVLTRRRRAIPIERIQNIEIQRPLLARITGTARVRVETGGSAGTEGVLELISLETAHRLRDAIRAFQRELRAEPAVRPLTEPVATEAPATPYADDHSEELYRMELGRVLLSGVFRFSLIYIVVMFSGLEYLNIDPVEIFEWIEHGPLRPVATFATNSPVVAVLVSLLVASLIAWLTGILVNLSRFFRFRLFLHGDKLHSKQGLITLQEATIPLQRVQAFILRTNPLMRRLGWWALDVQTLGLESSRRGRSIVVPFARESEILEVLRRFEPVEPPEAFDPVSRLTIRRRFLRYGAVLFVVCGGLSFLWSDVLWGLFLLPVLGAFAYGEYRNHGYRLSDEYLFVRSGLVRHHVWIIPAQKRQAFFATSTLFQRRLRLASLEVDTAGAPDLRVPRVVDLPRDTADGLFDELVQRFRDARNSGGRQALRASPFPSAGGSTP